MNPTTLQLPIRSAKPRAQGITMMVDGGLPTSYFADVVASAHRYLDFVKFGWGTALVTDDLEAKVRVLRRHDVGFYFGGTLFEKFVLQDRFDDFRELCHRHSCEHVEVSNGTIDLSNMAKAGYIRKLADEFTVISEVGYKDGDRSEKLPPHRWIEYVNQDLDAGAQLVTLEARESGKSGICRPDGQLRYGLIEELLSCGFEQGSLLFEAPSSALQTYFITRVGHDVNLGNVAATDLVALETLRLGLRADTLLALEPCEDHLDVVGSRIQGVA